MNSHDDTREPVSGYLLRSSRSIIRACKDRLGWTEIAEAPCGICPLLEPCQQQQQATKGKP